MELFHFQNQDFPMKTSEYFKTFKNFQNLSDVTLVSDDMKHIQAHKLVLSACSEYFRNILEHTNKSHAYIFIDGVNSRELEQIHEFIYSGEVTFHQNDLNLFMASAKKLKIEGIEDEKNQKVEPIEFKNEDPDSYVDFLEIVENGSEVEEVSASSQLNSMIEEEENKIVEEKKHLISTNQPNRLANGMFTTTYPIKKFKIENGKTVSIEEFRSRLDDCIVDASDGSLSCSICGKVGAKVFDKKGYKLKSVTRQNMRRHVEIHFEGLSVPCKDCGKSFSTSRRMEKHRNRKCILNVIKY